MIIDDLVKNPGAWLSTGQETAIVISSRVRLARNLKGRSFPALAKQEDRVRVCNEVTDALRQVPCLRGALFLDMGGLDALDREILKERHLISSEFTERGRGSGLVVTKDEGLAIMINEEVCLGKLLRSLLKFLAGDSTIMILVNSMEHLFETTHIL